VPTLDQRADHARVQSAILRYLLVFVALNLYVWISYVPHRHQPHRFPLGSVVERFGDLLRFSGKYQIGKDPRMIDSEHLIGTLFPKNYPPFAVVVYLFLLQVCAPYALFVMLGIVVCALVVACTLLWRRVRRFESYRWYIGLAIFATGLFGWGMEQVVMRANIEGLMWILVCLGAVLYSRRQYGGAAVAFGASCCLKPFPVLWIGLLARHRRYREVGITLISAAVVTMASLLVIDRNPLRAYRRLDVKSDFFRNYVVAFRPITEDHSLFQSMKMIAHVVRDQGRFLEMERGVQLNDPIAWKLYRIYLLLAAVIGLVTLWRVWNKPVLNQVFALACVTTVLPMVSGDYTLSVLLIPMGFFLIFLLQDVAAGRAPMSRGEMLWFLLPCAWIMAPEPLVIFHSVFKCIALMLLLGASIVIPLPSTLFGETAN
jgi:hypothetical protein